MLAEYEALRTLERIPRRHQRKITDHLRPFGSQKGMRNMNAKYLSFLGFLIVGCTAQVELGDRGAQGGNAAVATGGSGSGGQPGTQAAVGGQTASLAVCGNGNLEGIEQCDDGNTLSGDGCSSTCQAEAAFMCTGSPSVCIIRALCGNATT